MLVETHEGKLLEWYSSGLCEFYYYLLNDSRVVNIPAGFEGYVYEPYDAFLSHMEDTFFMKRIPGTYPIPRVKRLPGFQKIDYEYVDQAEVDRLRLEAMPFNQERRVFRVKDGRILVDLTLFGEVYKNEEDYLAVKAFKVSSDQYYSRRMRGNFSGIIEPQLCGLNPLGEKFPAHVDELAAQLPGLLDAPEKFFDGREECLPRIDKYLYKRLITPEFQEQVFLPLLAYIGKTFIANRGGEWVMLYDEASDHWLPDIRQTDGEMKMLYHPISLILDPDEGHGICIPMKVVYQHRASNPESWD